MYSFYEYTALVQWPLLRDFSDQLSCSGVEACLLPSFVVVLLMTGFLVSLH
jgi:hypothetical protein